MPWLLSHSFFSLLAHSVFVFSFFGSLNDRVFYQMIKWASITESISNCWQYFFPSFIKHSRIVDNVIHFRCEYHIHTLTHTVPIAYCLLPCALCVISYNMYSVVNDLRWKRKEKKRELDEKEVKYMKERKMMIPLAAVAADCCLLYLLLNNKWQSVWNENLWTLNHSQFYQL